MEKVVVQTGAKTYQITDQDGNDLGVFRFIPSDAGILKRYKEAAAFFTGINDKIKDKDFEEILPDLEKEAGEKIDLLFGAPVSESFFKITSPFTVLESGETFAEQIITVIGGIIEKELEAREKAQQERVRKYIAKRYSAYGRSTKECAENELRIREEIKAGLYNSNKNITLDAYFDEWEKSRRGTIKDSSIKINRSKYNNHIRPVLGKIKVQKIEKRAVVKLQQDLSKKLSASMTNGVIVLLKTVLNAAVDDEILIKNPAASVKPLRKDDRPKASETIHRALTREEQQAFMQEAKTEWLYEFFCFSLCTGMRLNEITALKWQDIDYINNVIRVNKTVSWKEGGGIEETLPKSDTSNRDIPMNDTIKKILQMQKTKMSMVYGEIHARKMDSNIFIGSNGAKAIASSTVSSAIDNVLKRLRQQGTEIERFTHHAFRDTFATRYIEEGGNMQTLQKILGHSSLAMTADLYAHVLPNTKQQEMQQIENGFIGVAVL